MQQPPHASPQLHTPSMQPQRPPQHSSSFGTLIRPNARLGSSEGPATAIDPELAGGVKSPRGYTTTFVGSSNVERAEDGGGVGKLAARAKKASRKEDWCGPRAEEDEADDGVATPGIDKIGGSSIPPT